MFGPCAKRRVVCVIKDAAGRPVATGENWCANPQEVCPREEGEDYTKCKTVCQQFGHAEEVALRLAQAAQNAKDSEWIRNKDGTESWSKPPLKNATAEVYGHTYACRNCQETLYQGGVRYISIYRNLP